MHWMLMPLRRYADFRGRSRRMEFWMWVLFQIIMVIVLTILDNVLGLGGRHGAAPTVPMTPGTQQFGYSGFASGGVLTGIWTLAVLIPNLAVQVRRLHDIDRTGWWIVVPIIAYIPAIAVVIGGAMQQNVALIAVGGIFGLLALAAGIVLLVFACLPGTRGPNRFGVDPLDPNATADLSDVFR